MKNSDNKLAYEWDYDGACSPAALGHAGQETFSLGIFQWIPKANGGGLKRGKVIRRIRGRCDNAAAVFDVAIALCKSMNESTQAASEASA